MPTAGCMGERTLVFLEIYKVILIFLAMHIIQKRSENIHLALSIKDLEAVHKQQRNAKVEL